MNILPFSPLPYPPLHRFNSLLSYTLRFAAPIIFVTVLLLSLLVSVVVPLPLINFGLLYHFLTNGLLYKTQYHPVVDLKPPLTISIKRTLQYQPARFLILDVACALPYGLRALPIFCIERFCGR